MTLSPDSAQVSFCGEQHESLSTLKMTLVNANRRAVAAGESKLPGLVNYFTGNDARSWTRNIATYEKVRFREVYPGIDVLYYGNQGQVEYDFIASVGADISAIRLEFEGAAKIQKDTAGNITITVGKRRLSLRKPTIYQEEKGTRRPIEGHYRLEGSRWVSFEVTHYDKAKGLVIDPVIVYSTLVGGSGSDYNYGAAVDSVGNIYLTGSTSSPDFPGGTGFPAGGNLAYVTKLNASGSAVIYSTYIGGSGYDAGVGVAVDPLGNAVITGDTYSTDFPLVTPIQATSTGKVQTAFIAKVNAAGDALLYSTYLGGSGGDSAAAALALDSSGNAYITGSTASSDFPYTAGAFMGTKASVGGAFLCKLRSSGTNLAYCGLLGAGVATDVAVDSAASAYVTGFTSDSGFSTTPRAAQSANKGGFDGFVFKMNPAGTAPVYSTLLGGAGGDSAYAIVVDSYGQAYVSGSTGSADFPVTRGAPQSSFSGTADGFVTKINAAGTQLLYSTYLGGRNYQAAARIALDPSGNAVVVGYTNSPDFPISFAVQGKMAGSNASLYKFDFSSGPGVWLPADAGFSGIANSVSYNPKAGSMVVATGSGVYRQAVAGGTWMFTSNEPLNSLARSSSDPGTIMGAAKSFYYLSRDDGRTWTHTGYSGIVGVQTGFAVDPSQPSIVYAFGPNGTAFSGNSGQDFAFLGRFQFPTYAGVVVPGSPNILLVFNSLGLASSVDFGSAWNVIPGVTGNAFAVDPNALGTVYAFGSGELYVSADSGAAWRVIPTPGKVTALAVAFGNSSILFGVVSDGVITSFDGGTHWSNPAPGLYPPEITSIAANKSTAFVTETLPSTGFVTKLNSTGTGLLYSTFLGGTGFDTPLSVVTSGNDAIVAGYTRSSDFPTTRGALRETPAGDSDVFVTRISDLTAVCSHSLANVYLEEFRYCGHR